MTKKKETSAVPEMKEMKYEDWMAEGKRRFGEDFMDWRFVYCNCGHVQAISDFRELHLLGKFKGSPNDAYFSCVGRFDDRIPRSQIGELGDTEGKKYCNYTLGGLLVLNKLVVVMEDGKRNPVFEFAEATIKKDAITSPEMAGG